MNHMGHFYLKVSFLFSLTCTTCARERGHIPDIYATIRIQSFFLDVFLLQMENQSENSKKLKSMCLFFSCHTSHVFTNSKKKIVCYCFLLNLQVMNDNEIKNFFYFKCVI